MEKTLYIIVVAAGSGNRFGADKPKQFCMLEGMPVLCHTIHHLLQAQPTARIITVVSAGMADYWRELAAMHNTPSGQIVIGGRTRWESVKNALALIDDNDESSIILVHDGARPLVDNKTVQGVVASVKYGFSSVPVIPVTDSLRYIQPDGTSTAVNRSDYRAVVTPQGFMLGDLRKAYRLPYSATFTDDASVMAAAGFTETCLVESSPSNIKITNPGDLALATWYLTHRK